MERIALLTKFREACAKVTKAWENKSLLITFFVFLVALTIHSLLPIPDNLLLLATKLAIGLVTFIVIPGLYITHLLDDERLKNIGFALIFGFLFQLLNVFIIWWQYTIFGKISFVNALRFLTILFTLVAMLYGTKKGREIRWRSFFRIDQFLAFAFLFFVLIALCYQVSSSSPHSDGAVYLDLARNVVRDNVFSSNTLHLPNSWADVQWSTGMIDYFFGYSAIAIFFALGDISLLSAKLMLILAGSLALFPLFEISAKLFSRQVARIAVSIASISPIMLTHVSLVGGPEVVSILYMLTTIYLVSILADKEAPSLRLCILTGITAFVAWYAWLITGYLLVLSVPFFFLLYRSMGHKEPNGYALLVLTLLIASLFLDVRLIGHLTYRYLLLPFPLAFFLTAFAASKLIPKIRLPRFYITFLATALCLLFLASYMPRLVSPQFIHFDASNYPIAQDYVAAHAVANVDLLKRVLDIDRVRSVIGSYLYGGSLGWAGLFNSIGAVTVFLAIASLARLDRLRQTFLAFSFPVLHMLMWILVSPDYAVQPRYLLCVAPFYFMLTASTIGLIVSTIDSTTLEKLKIKVLNKSSHSGIDLNKILVSILLISTLFAFWQPIYKNSSGNIDFWNYREKYGWNDAIEWIGSNTASDDVMACVEGGYFSWYSDRQTAFMWDIPNENVSTLIELIRVLKVNYLVVDEAFGRQFKNLSGFYDSPHPFMGSKIVFASQNEVGKKVIIYNVTNIAYGNFLRYDFEPEWKEPKNWAPLAFYSAGNVSSDQDAVKFVFSVKANEWSSAAATYVFGSSIDLSKYSSAEFWIKVPESRNVVLEICSERQGGSYYAYSLKNTLYNQWVKLVVNLDSYIYVYGDPDLQDVNELHIIVGGLSVDEVATFWIRDLKFSGEEYILEKP